MHKLGLGPMNKGIYLHLDECICAQLNLHVIVFEISETVPNAFPSELS